MSDVNINREVALRIALATRTLKETSIKQVLDALVSCIDGELTKKAIFNLSAEEFLNAINKQTQVSFDIEGITDAIRIFRGEQNIEALPSIASDAEE